MQYIDVSGKPPMSCAANVPQVKYSAAYSTEREFGKKRHCVTSTVSEEFDYVKPFRG